MKRLALITIIILSLAWLLLPTAVLAQEDYCVYVNGTQVQTSTVTLNFDTSWHLFDLNTLGQHEAIVNGDSESIPSCTQPLLGTHDPAFGVVRSINCGHSGNSHTLSVGGSSIQISSPVTGTKTVIDTAPGGGGAGQFVGVDFYCGTGAGYDNLGHLSQSSSINMDYNTSCDGIGLINARLASQRWFRGITVMCGVGTYPDPPSPPAQVCSLIPNADFETTADWLLAGTAAITNSTLTLASGDSADQNLSGVSSNSSYEAILDVTNVVSSPATVAVVLGVEFEEIEISGPGTYNVSLNTGTLAGPIAVGLQNDGPGDVEIDFVCLSLQSEGGIIEECIAPPNGTFTTNTDWDFFNGAAYNSALNAALIPLNNPETHSNPFYTAAFMTSSDSFSLPTVSGAENLLLSFDAQSLQNQNALLTTLVENQAETIDYEFIYEIYPQKYTFEADISNLAGESSAILFGNDGGYPDIMYPDDISLDNVCIFIAERDPNLPAPVDPGAIAPVSIGATIDCDDVTGFMISFGIDMRYYREVYATSPSVWNPQDWVPWLIAASFVGLQIYLCAFFAGLQSILNIIEYLLNNGLNYAYWFRRNWTLGVPWLASWGLTFLGSFDNFVEAFRATAENWLVWAGLAVVEFAEAYEDSADNLAILTLTTSLGFIWLGGLLFPLFVLLVADLNNVATGLLNTLIDEGWNAFLIELGNVISQVASVFVGIWNSSLVPFLQYVLPVLLAFINPVSGFIYLMGVVFSFLWTVVMYLWVNVFMLINIPFSFYTGLQAGIQSTAFGDLLACDGSTLNFWCNFLSAVDLLNNIMGHSIFYPIVIVGIIIGTIAILWRNFLGVWNLYIDILSKI